VPRHVVSSSSPLPPASRRIGGLDGLRGLAALAVVAGNGVVLLASPAVPVRR
jgi:peptidoglycan/LPS O-acetylase OafA/YrhL